MSAYLIARVQVTDPEKYEDYKALAAPAIAAAGGKYLARGGECVSLEGDAETRRVVIVEFANLKAARDFYDGEAYRKARAAREGAALGQFMVVDGV